MADLHPHLHQLTEWDGREGTDSAGVVEHGDLVAVKVPCPGRLIYRGGVGGQMMTTCRWCNEVMASTAGPHSADGEAVQVLVVTDVFPRRNVRYLYAEPLRPWPEGQSDG